MIIFLYLDSITKSKIYFQDGEWCTLRRGYSMGLLAHVIPIQQQNVTTWEFDREPLL